MNNFPVIGIHQGNLEEFVTCWSRLYDYDQLYQEAFYNKHIYNNPLTKDDITELFIWKNGMPLSVLKGESLNKKILPKLDLINQYRNESVDFETIQTTFNNLSAIWLIFVAHIISPRKYPIFDQHVYRAFIFLRDKVITRISENDKIKLRIYQDEYLPFFNRYLVHIDNHKKLDEAMWSFGRFLSLYPQAFS